MIAIPQDMRPAISVVQGRYIGIIGGNFSTPNYTGIPLPAVGGEIPSNENRSDKIVPGVAGMNRDYPWCQASRVKWQYQPPEIRRYLVDRVRL